MELVCSARETVLTQEMRQTTTGARPDPDDAADDAAGNEGEPKTKIARLVYAHDGAPVPVALRHR